MRVVLCFLLVALALAEIQTQLNAKEQARYDWGKAFLVRNSEKPGIIMDPSGLQIRVLRDGDGLVHPVSGATVETHQEGRTGEEYERDPTGENSFESTYMPRRTSMDVTINGTWTFQDKILQRMVEGDKWELFMPPGVYKNVNSRWKNGAFGHGFKCKDAQAIVYILEIVKINSGKTIPRSDPVQFTELADVDAHSNWVAENTGKVLMLGLLRQPLTSKMYQSFLSAARKVGPNVAVALHAGSKYDSKTQKYTISPLETALKKNAPTVVTSVDGGASWNKCTLPRANDVGASRAAMVDCAAAAAGASNRDEL